MQSEVKRKTKVITLIDAADLVVPVAKTVTVNSDPIDIAGYESAVFFCTLGTETGTVTFDAKLQYADSNGNYYDVASGALTQMTAAGGQQLVITKIYGHTARVVYVLAGANAAEKFAGATLELVLKS